MPKRPKPPVTASLRHELHYYRLGYHCILALDEAGRGPLAGPVVAAAVALPLAQHKLSRSLQGVRDSKLMSPRQREAAAEDIKARALFWGIGACSAADIDRHDILTATKIAMRAAITHALRSTLLQPDCLFLDYMLLPELPEYHQVSIVAGDRHSLSIASASVLAKVWRDAHMQELDGQYPQYGFAQHKGYATAAHRRALALHGPCPAHRHSFAPVMRAGAG